MTAGAICLQGGRELTPPCDEMDRTMLSRVTGRAVVIAGAARVGSDYDDASARTVAHYARLGAAVDVVPDPRTDPLGGLDALGDDVGLVILPGGSPGGLLDVLAVRPDHDAASVGERLTSLWRTGTAISGASAGAMVLCTVTVTPDRTDVSAAGLGMVAGVALPHWSPGSERRWTLPDGVRWGLPECGGVVIDDDRMIGVGQGAASVDVGDGWRALGRDQPEPLPR